MYLSLKNLLQLYSDPLMKLWQIINHLWVANNEVPSCTSQTKAQKTGRKHNYLNRTSYNFWKSFLKKLYLKYFLFWEWSLIWPTKKTLFSLWKIFYTFPKNAWCTFQLQAQSKKVMPKNFLCFYEKTICYKNSWIFERSPIWPPTKTCQLSDGLFQPQTENKQKNKKTYPEKHFYTFAKGFLYFWTDADHA